MRANTIVKKQNAVHRSMYVKQRGLLSVLLVNTLSLHALYQKPKKKLLRRFVGVDPPFDKIVKNPDRWFKEKATRVSALTEKKVIDAATNIISQKVRACALHDKSSARNPLNSQNSLPPRNSDVVASHRTSSNGATTSDLFGARSLRICMTTP